MAAMFAIGYRHYGVAFKNLPVTEQHRRQNNSFFRERHIVTIRRRDIKLFLDKVLRCAIT